MAIAPFWYSREVHCWTTLMPFWLSAEEILCFFFCSFSHHVFLFPLSFQSSHLHRNVRMIRAVDEFQLHRVMLKDEDAWERQIAACTIQLAWRRYYRRKLLKALGGNKRLIHTYDPEIMALRQHLTLHKIYGRHQQEKKCLILQVDTSQHLPDCPWACKNLIWASID